MKKLFLVIIVFIQVLNSQAQTDYNSDSLWNIWQDKSQQDSTRSMSLLLYTANEYLFSDPDSALIFLDMVEDLSEDISFDRGLSRSLKYKGVAYFILSDYSKALDYSLQAYKIFEKHNEEREMASVSSNIGAMYATTGLRIKALEAFEKSLKLSQAINSADGIATASDNIASLYFQQGNYEAALKGYQQAYEVYKDDPESQNVAVTLNNIANVYSQQENYADAITYYKNSIELHTKNQDLRGLIYPLRGLGVAYQGEGKFEDALFYLKRSLEVSEEVKYQNGVSVALHDIGALYYDQKKFKDAINYCHKAYKLSQEIGDLNNESSSCDCLYKSYKGDGNATKALEYHEKHSILLDSINENSTAMKLQEVEFSKEIYADSLSYAKKEAIKDIEILKQGAELSKQRVALGATGGGIILLISLIYSVRKGKKRSDELLHNILPEEVATELKQNGKVGSKRIDHVTVLFTDFKGFTAMAENMSANDLVEDLNVCFSEFDRIMEKYGIEKIKTIGDSYMAAGGLPVPNSTHAMDVVNAAFELVEFVRLGKEKKIASNQPFFEIRVGVHTGPVVAGIVGVKKFQYDIWGDTVNTASRMESSGEVGKVNISQTTYELINESPNLVFENRGEIQAKGKGEMQMYFVEKKSA